MDLLTTVIGILVLVGFITLVLHLMGKLPQLWVPVLFLFIIEFLRVLPVGG